MYLNKVKKNLIQDNLWLILIVLVFLISAGAYMLTNMGRERVLLYFPDSVQGELVGEYRVLPRERGRENRIAQLVEEVILGPANIRSYNIFQRSTKVRSVHIFRGGTAVVDLDRQAMARIADRDLSVQDSLDILNRSVVRNFPGLREIIVLIDGQETYVQPYIPEEL